MEKWANRQTLAREAEDKKKHTDKFKRQLGLADELRQNYDKQTERKSRQEIKVVEREQKRTEAKPSNVGSADEEEKRKK